MLWLKFGGWFQCRLATDSDPTDEPRGVSGYVAAVAGEPDLDRIVRFQDPVAPRSHCPTAGVRVTAVYRDGILAAADPLKDARVELLNSPKFEGRNGIITEAGFEPIVPFHLKITKDQMSVDRPHLDREDAPYAELQATGINAAPGAIAEATGVWNIAAAWTERLEILRNDFTGSVDPEVKAALSRRMETLANLRLTRFFSARMEYAFSLKGTSTLVDPDNMLGGQLDRTVAWPIEFWCGAWDPDALCGFVQGFVGLPVVGRTAEVAAIDSESKLFAELAALAASPNSDRRA